MIVTNKATNAIETMMTIKYNNDTGKEKYLCNTCQKTYSYPSQMDTHIRVHTGERPFLCNKCTKSFKSKNNLMQHLNTHSRAQIFSCSQCTKSFTRRSNFNKHVQEKHPIKPSANATLIPNNNHIPLIILTPPKGPYQCSQCDSSFANKGWLTRHMLETHPIINQTTLITKITPIKHSTYSSLEPLPFENNISLLTHY
jgi:KRAB domain-containing zinc finger protein